jgi:hypothetical protein
VRGKQKRAKRREKRKIPTSGERRCQRKPKLYTS